ncbi:MAG: cupin domain-containing protein [Haliscomenobacter sp.]|uniref:cupin domain-containing protein n=1 Tax=Haliscomenobacter sp. TaxID=2717303 RepID=UPI0029B79641|nr:cupin domain-containing protein [Haliscomenobacter sp.]MDX2068571.1 cupin domain-containing protein [Haliscomenobacter sp.]
MQYPFKLPHKIQNFSGEVIVFKERLIDQDGIEMMLIENEVAPGSGPPFHVHFLQDEYLKVLEGTMGYQSSGEPEKIAKPGEAALFKRGEVHRFWNAGDTPLRCEGWVKPANSLDFYLAAVYASMDKAGKHEGDPFDSAYLTTRYRTEYDIMVIPIFVKRVVMPIIVLIGKLLGKYKHFASAPAPLK